MTACSNIEATFEVYQKLFAQFTDNPNIENYLTLRRSWPYSDVQLDSYLFFDPILESRAELERVGINPCLVSDALNGDEYQIDELCLQLMEKLIERDRLEKTGKTHLQSRGSAIPDSVVDFLVAQMVEICTGVDISPPCSLVYLIRHRLQPAGTPRRLDQSVVKRRREAIFQSLLASGFDPNITMRQVAKTIGVQPSTISRWFKDADFREEVGYVRGQFKKPNDWLQGNQTFEKSG